MTVGTDLARYGVVAATIVREPARDSQGILICAECGHPVEQSKGSQIIEKPNLIDRDLYRSLKQLVTFGWRYERHGYEIVLPSRAYGPDAPAMESGWTGVRLQFSDEHVRHVPVPERELAEGSQ